jgi:hypothetical protein
MDHKDLSFFPVMRDHLLTAWQRALPLLSPAIQQGDEVDDAAVLAELQANLATLWVLVKHPEQTVVAAAVTVLETTPRRRVCRVWLTGALRGYVNWQHLAERIASWARTQGCSALILRGRRGWTKALPNWRLKNVELEFKL